MVQWHNGVAQLTIPTPFAVGDVHLYVIKGEIITLVDTGPKTKEAWNSLQEQLQEIGLSIKDIDQIVLTHHHPDHAGLIDRFDHARILGAAEGNRFLVRDDTFMTLHDSFYETFFKQMGLPESYFILIEKMREPLQALGNRGLDEMVSEGQVLPGAAEWMITETPGHAQGHISLYRSTDGLMIGGDMLLANVSSNPLIEPPLNQKEKRPYPQLQYNHSLNKLLNFSISSLLPGHGPAVENAHELIRTRLNKQHERAIYVKQLLSQKDTTAFELCVKLFPGVYRKQLGLTLSETMGQVDYLLSIGEIEVADEVDGAFIYRALTETKEPIYEQELKG